MIELAIALAIGVVGYLLWKSGKLDAIVNGTKTKLTPTGAPPVASRFDPPQAGVPKEVASAIGYTEKLSEAGCAAIARSKKVPGGAADLGCNIYGYLTPFGQAAAVVKYVPGATTAVNGIQTGAVTSGKAIASAANTTYNAASRAAAATASTLSKALPWNW